MVKTQYDADSGEMFSTPEAACDRAIKLRTPDGTKRTKRPTAAGSQSIECYYEEPDGTVNSAYLVHADCPENSRLNGTTECECYDGYVARGDKCVEQKAEAVPPATSAPAAPAGRMQDRLMPQHRVRCFNTKELGRDQKKLKEMATQLRRQQEAINELTVDQFLVGQWRYEDSEEPRKGEDRKQRAARKAYAKKISDSMAQSRERRQLSDEMNKAKAGSDSEKLKRIMATLNALHEPDTRAFPGGKVPRLGDAQVNSLIGRQWIDEFYYTDDSRVHTMTRAALEAREKLGSDAKMNITLEPCRE